MNKLHHLFCLLLLSCLMTTLPHQAIAGICVHPCQIADDALGGVTDFARLVFKTDSDVTNTFRIDSDYNDSTETFSISGPNFDIFTIDRFTPTESFKILANGDIEIPEGDLFLLDNHRLGIGTTTIAEEITIQDPNPQIRLLDSTVGLLTNFADLAVNEKDFLIEGENGQDLLKMRIDAPANSVVLKENGDMELGVGVLFLDNVNNRLGIAESNPLVPLHISNANDAKIRLRSVLGGGRMDLGYDGSWMHIDGSNAGAVKIAPAAQANSLVVASGGSVGIGTDTPGSELHIVDGLPAIFLEDTTDSTISKLRYNGGNFSMAGSNNQNILQLDATSPALTIASDASGNIGFGTDNPEAALHIRGGTANIMLHETPSNAKAILGMNGQNLILNGEFSPLIASISTQAPSNSLLVSNTGNFQFIQGGIVMNNGSQSLGIGATLPSAPLEVQRADGTARILVNETTATAGARTLFELRNPGNTKFEIVNTDANESWAFTNSGTDFRISRQGSGVVEFRVNNAGDAFLEGVLTEGSDRNSKTNIEALDYAQVLKKVKQLPVSRWQYKDAVGKNHIGPMAQDFYAAFGLGNSDKHLATLDTSGVALAAIKALAEENQQLQSENLDMRQRLSALEHSQQLVSAQQKLLESLQARLTLLEQELNQTSTPYLVKQ